MQFVDGWTEQVFTMKDFYRDWKDFRQEDPDNHCETFTAEYLEILLATINGRNDLEIIGMTPKEVSNIIDKLMRKEGIRL